MMLLLACGNVEKNPGPLSATDALLQGILDGQTVIEKNIKKTIKGQGNLEEQVGKMAKRLTTWKKPCNLYRLRAK